MTYTVIERENGKIPAMDFLQGFSVFTIALSFLSQMMSAVPPVIQMAALIGRTGVQAFFLVFGMEMYLSDKEKTVSFSGIMGETFVKKYVPYFFIIIVSFFFPWTYYSGSDRYVALLSQLFLVQYEETFGIHFWFVSTIIQLSLLFIPIRMMKNRIRNSKAFFCFFLGISIFWWTMGILLGLSDVRIFTGVCFWYIWAFALGFLIAEKIWNRGSAKINNGWLCAAAVAGIGIQAESVMVSNVLKAYNDIPALLGYMSLALLMMRFRIIRKVAVFLSGVSYEFWLVHILVFEMAFHFFKPEGLIKQSFVGLGSMILACIISYLYHKLIVNCVVELRQPENGEKRSAR